MRLSQHIENAREYVEGALYVFGMATGLGPDWRWVAGIGGSLVMLIGGFAVNQHVSDVRANFTEVKAVNGIQDVRLATHAEELSALKVRLERLPIIEAKIDALREDRKREDERRR